MATAPMISTPSAPGGTSGLGTALRGHAAAMRRKKERERKERELFEKLSIQNEVDQAAEAALADLPQTATPVDRAQAVEGAISRIAAGYGDQDAKQAQQAEAWGRKTWTEPYRTKAETYLNGVNEERIASQYATTAQDYRLRMDDALRRSVSPDLSQPEREAAAVEYSTLVTEMTQLAVLVDPKVAGDQLADFNRQHPKDAMGVIEEAYANRGGLVQLQKEIRAGRFQQFRSRINVDDRRAFDEALAVRIGKEAQAKVRLRDAQERAEKDRQEDLEAKMAVTLTQTTVPVQTVKAQYRARGASESTINAALKAANTQRDETNKIVTARGRDGMVASNNRWMDTRTPGSKLDIVDLQMENDERLRNGQIDDDLHGQNQAAIRNMGERIELIGDANASILSEVRRNWSLKIGLPQSPDQWNDENNATGAMFNAAANEIEDLFGAAPIERDTVDTLYELVVTSMVARDHLDWQKSNLFPGYELDAKLEPEKQRGAIEAMVRKRAHRLRNIIQREGFLDEANVQEIYDVVSVPVEAGVAPLRVNAQFPEGQYDREATMLAVQGLGLDEAGQSAMMTAIEANVDQAMKLKGMAGMVKTFGEIAEETKQQAAAAKAERELAEEEAAAAQAQAEETGPLWAAGMSGGERRVARRQQHAPAQTFALPEIGPVDVRELPGRAEQMRELGEERTRRMTETQRRLRERIGRTPTPRGRGQMGRRRR